MSRANMNNTIPVQKRIFSTWAWVVIFSVSAFRVALLWWFILYFRTHFSLATIRTWVNGPTMATWQQLNKVSQILFPEINVVDNWAWLNSHLSFVDGQIVLSVIVALDTVLVTGLILLIVHYLRRKKTLQVNQPIEQPEDTWPPAPTTL